MTPQGDQSLGVGGRVLACLALFTFAAPSEAADPRVPQPDTPMAARRALKARLQELTDAVAASEERRVYGVHRPAHIQDDPKQPQTVRGVVLNVNVYWCDDGCVDGPTRTPARDDDLALLSPFATSLRRLDARQTDITDRGLATLAQLTELESLNLAGTPITGSGLARLSPLSSLQHLDLRETRLDPDTLEPLAELTSLRSLHLPSAALTDEALKILARLPRLEHLDLSKSRVTDRGLSALTSLGQLEHLDLSETAVTDAGLAHLSRLEKLVQVNLARTRVAGPGLASLAHATHLQHLDLAGTQTQDAHLTSLAGLKNLTTLQLAGTAIRGTGFAYLSACTSLRTASLPPLSIHAAESLNAIKSWSTLTLHLESDPDRPDPASIRISDMPDMSSLQLTSTTPLPQLQIRNCPQLASIAIHHIVARNPSRPEDLSVLKSRSVPATSLLLEKLPRLRNLALTGRFNELQGDAVQHVTQVALEGSITTQTVRGILQCQELRDLNLRLSEVAGEPLATEGLAPLPQVASARIDSTTGAATWLTRLIAAMPNVRTLDLRIPGLRGSDLDRLAICTQVQHLSVRGIDDPGEPLAFLNALPDLDQCLVLGCPRVGRIRLTPQAGVKRFYFKYGRLDQLEIHGAPNLTTVSLGHEAHGYNDEDARLNSLDAGSISVSEAPELLYLFADAGHSSISFRQVALSRTPQLRSLLVKAPSLERHPQRCRMSALGEYPRLVQRRLFHVTTDQHSLDRLNNSPILQGGELVDVEVSPPEL